jgi:hypothetical protein
MVYGSGCAIRDSHIGNNSHGNYLLEVNKARALAA